ERHHFAPYPFDQRQKRRSEDTVTFPVGTPLKDIEREMILRTLDKTGNNKTRAATLLNISLKTLHNKLNEYRARGLLRDRADGKSPLLAAAFLHRRPRDWDTRITQPLRRPGRRRAAGHLPERNSPLTVRWAAVADRSMSRCPGPSAERLGTDYDSHRRQRCGGDRRAQTRLS